VKLEHAFDKPTQLVRDLAKRGGWSTVADLKTIGWGQNIAKSVRECDDWSLFVTGTVNKGGVGRPSGVVGLKALRDAGVLQDPYMLGLEDIVWDDQRPVDVPPLTGWAVKVLIEHGLGHAVTKEERTSIALTPSAGTDPADLIDPDPIPTSRSEGLPHD
jgi:hypothetical protein